jgi:hypothetical protein
MTSGTPMSRRARQVALSGDDVDMLRRVARAADLRSSSSTWRREVFTSVHVARGLAFASDGYKLAIGEVDTDDEFEVPARAVEWLPLAGCTITVKEMTEVWSSVSWEVDDGTVGGDAFRWHHGDVVADVTAVMGHPPNRYRPLPDTVPTAVDGITWGTDDKRTFCVIGPATGPLRLFDRKLLNEALALVADDTNVYIGFAEGKPGRVGEVGQLWLCGDDLTVVLMPVIPHQALNVWTWGTPWT